jgi:acid phosphatase (class A)
MARHGRHALLVVLLCLGGLSARAQTLPDAKLVLPPPPVAGSPRASAELEELKRYQGSSTAEALAAAAYDDKHEDGTIFAAVLGPDFDLTRMPATVAMLATVGKAESAATKDPKTFFHRDRPWIVDPGIKTCTPHKAGPASNSYPSGHTTVGFAMAEILAAMMPDKAQGLLARAGVFAENRLVCGYHFRSDIVAGQEFGTMLAQSLMQDSAFQVQMAAARSELHAAKLIP